MLVIGTVDDRAVFDLKFAFWTEKQWASILKYGSNFPRNKFLNKSRHFKVTVEGKLGDIAIHVDSSCKNMMIRVLGTIYFPSWSIFLSTSDAIIPRRKLKKRQRLKYRYKTVLSNL